MSDDTSTEMILKKAQDLLAPVNMASPTDAIFKRLEALQTIIYETQAQLDEARRQVENARVANFSALSEKRRLCEELRRREAADPKVWPRERVRWL